MEVEPGAKLALHHHLGTQISRIESGTLTYTVRRGIPVVIYLATLLKDGAPPATPVSP